MGGGQRARLLDFVSERVGRGEVKLLVLLTKADKLNRNQQLRALATAQKALGQMATDAADISVSLFSALSRQGLGDAALTLRQWRDAPSAAVVPVTPDADANAGAAVPDAGLSAA